MRFSKLYEELKFDDVFKKASPEEVKERKNHFETMRILDNFEKSVLSDGTFIVHQDLYIINTSLTSLKPLNVSIVEGDFICFNTKITSLEGCPKRITGNLDIEENNNLTSLVGCPVKVGRTFICARNRLLTNLNGSPKEVLKSFECTRNRNLTSLEGAPKTVGGVYWAYNNAKKFTADYVYAVCHVHGSVRI